jgi:hypothetical protein
MGLFAGLPNGATVQQPTFFLHNVLYNAVNPVQVRRTCFVCACVYRQARLSCSSRTLDPTSCM